MTKTPEEIKEADLLETEASKRHEGARETAQSFFHEATKDEQALFEPHRKRWQEFVEPVHKEYRMQLVQALKVYEAEREGLRLNWGSCSKCGDSYARYQTFCANDICGVRLEKE